MILADRFWGSNIISKECFLENMKATLRSDNVLALHVPSVQDALWMDLLKESKVGTNGKKTYRI